MISKYPNKIIKDNKYNILQNFDYTFNNGRTSLKYGILLYSLQNSSILIPEYICEEVVTTLISLGLKIKYYQINDMLVPNYNEIEKNIDSSVKSILFVNYFGLPINLNTNINFSNKNNLLMIEDNAHGFSGVLNKKFLGTFGDIGISSPRKNLNIMSGGTLYVKDKNLIKKIKLSISQKTLKWKIFKFTPLIMFNFICVIIYYFKNLSKYNNSSIKINKNVDNNFIIDDTSKILINHHNFDKYNKIKRDIFFLWLNFLENNGFKVISSDVLDKFSPMCIAFKLNNYQSRDKIINFFHNNNIEAYTWPNLPIEIAKKRGNGYMLQKKIICIPITFEKNIKYIKNKIIKINQTFNDYII